MFFLLLHRLRTHKLWVTYVAGQNEAPPPPHVSACDRNVSEPSFILSLCFFSFFSLLGKSRAVRCGADSALTCVWPGGPEGSDWHVRRGEKKKKKERRNIHTCYKGRCARSGSPGTSVSAAGSSSSRGVVGTCSQLSKKWKEKKLKLKAGTSTPTRETPLCLTAATPSEAQVPDLCTDKEPCAQTKEIHDVPQ